MQMFMIACHMDNNKNVTGFRITDTDTGETKDFNYESVKAVLDKGIEIDGIKIEDGQIKGSNGVFSRYTNLINGITIGKCPLVIVKEYPNKYYDVCNHLGKVVKMSVDDIITFAKEEGLANGKIVEKDGKEFISSICGEYPKDKMFNDIASCERTKKKMIALDMDEIVFDGNNCISCKQTDKDEFIIGKGCMGVSDEGFKNNRLLKYIKLPDTATYFGKEAFMNCEKLETVNIPEGTVVIKKNCFYGCNSLKTVILPNSIREIQDGAFMGCTKLREISLGPVRANVSRTAFPRTARLKIRR